MSSNLFFTNIPFRENPVQWSMSENKINSDSLHSTTEHILLSFQFLEGFFPKMTYLRIQPRNYDSPFLLLRRNLTDRFLKRPPKRDNNGYLWNAWIAIGHPMSSTRNIAQYSGKGTKKRQSTLISKENFREFHDHPPKMTRNSKWELQTYDSTEKESSNDTSFIWNVKLAAVPRWFRSIGIRLCEDKSGTCTRDSSEKRGTSSMAKKHREIIFTGGGQWIPSQIP